MVVLAVFAAIIASQAMISATFSMIQQSIMLGCFPPVEIVHISNKHHGQVYIPKVNYLLMLACVAVTLTFRTTEKIGDAYGVAVVFVMILTSLFLLLIMVIIWKNHILLVIAYFLVIGVIEIIYLSSVLYKFEQGGYLPLIFAILLMSIMYIWNYVHRHKCHYELRHSISLDNVEATVAQTNSIRLPGLAIFHLNMVHGIPPFFQHYISNVPALHSVLIFVSFESLPLSNIPLEQRFIFYRVQPPDIYVFRCVVQFGYNDVLNEQEFFEELLMGRLKEFIREEHEPHESLVERDIEELDRAYSAGVVHLVGEEEMVASEGSSIAKKLIVNYAYHFLKRNLRQSDKFFDIPCKHMLKVGMTYEL